MRQQLITWLLEDIAPQIKQSRDAEGTILKFAREQNLAPSLVQALGQLYNTAKTIAFLEKSGSTTKRGDSFPILDVDHLLDRFMAVEKQASIATGKIDVWEADLENGGLELPDCFSGQLTPILQEEKVVNREPFYAQVKRAMAAQEIEALNCQLARQIVEDTREHMRKSAHEFVTRLRGSSRYPFEMVESDALGYLGDMVKPTMEKLAIFCQEDGWPVKRASSPTMEKMLNPYETEVINLVDSITSDACTIQAAQEYLKEAETKIAALSEIPSTYRPEPPKSPSTYRPEPSKPPKPSVESPDQPKKPRDKEEKEDFQDRRTFGITKSPIDLEQEVGKTLGLLQHPMVEPLASAKNILGSPYNQAQEDIDKSMLDTRHTALLQNLMTTDEILSEADPDRVVEIYNTIREVAPTLAADSNVMRVFLRSAIQHDGIAPFDLKGLIEGEIQAQNARFNERVNRELDYGKLEFQQPKPQLRK